MANNQDIIRACNMVFAPLNQLEKMAKEGYSVPLIKQGSNSEIPHLTARERECLMYFIDGKNIKNIAQAMNVSERRIQLIFESLRSKFSVNTDHWIITKYFQMGLDSAL